MVALSSLGGGGGSGSGGTPKVLFNGTLTAADLTGNDTFTLFTNDATTTVVIENVFVDATVGPFDTNGDLVSGAFFNDTVNLGQTVNLAGSEITAPSTSLTVTLDTALTLKDMSYTDAIVGRYMLVSNSTLARESVDKNISIPESNYPTKSIVDLVTKHIDATFTGVTTTVIDQSVPYINTNAAWYYEAGSKAYYFDSDGNSTTNLYIATIAGDGTVGNWAQLSNTSYAFVGLDVTNNKAYRNKDSYLYKVDLTTGLEVNIRGASGSPSTYSKCGAANNTMFYIITHNNANLYYYKEDTNEYGTIYISEQDTGARTRMGVCYNPDENKYYITINTSTFVIDWATKTYVQLAGYGAVYPNGLDQMYHMLGNSVGEMFIKSPTGLEIIGWANNVATLKSAVQINGQTDSMTYGAWVQKSQPVDQVVTLDADDYNVNLKCKVSGTEYKEA
jgi:hypothetical protein